MKKIYVIFKKQDDNTNNNTPEAYTTDEYIANMFMIVYKYRGIVLKEYYLDDDKYKEFCDKYNEKEICWYELRKGYGVLIMRKCDKKNIFTK